MVSRVNQPPFKTPFNTPLKPFSSYFKNVNNPKCSRDTDGVDDPGKSGEFFWIAIRFC